MSKYIERIDHEEADPKYNMPFVPAIKVHGGKLVFCSGTAAAPVYHSHPHRAEEFADIPESAEAQARIAMENLRRALNAAGADFKDVVTVTRFLTDIENDEAAINRVYGEYFNGQAPPNTTVEVPRLVFPMLRFEINAIAVVDE